MVGVGSTVCQVPPERPGVGHRDDLARSCCSQRPRAGVERRAGRVHVVDEQRDRPAAVARRLDRRAAAARRRAAADLARVAARARTGTRRAAGPCAARARRRCSAAGSKPRRAPPLGRRRAPARSPPPRPAPPARARGDHRAPSRRRPARDAAELQREHELARDARRARPAPTRASNAARARRARRARPRQRAARARRRAATAARARHAGAQRVAARRRAAGRGSAGGAMRSSRSTPRDAAHGRRVRHGLRHTPCRVSRRLVEPLPRRRSSCSPRRPVAYVVRWRRVGESPLRLALFLAGIATVAAALLSPDRPARRAALPHAHGPAPAAARHRADPDHPRPHEEAAAAGHAAAAADRAARRASSPTPVFAITLYVVTMWIWHIPALYDGALRARARPRRSSTSRSRSPAACTGGTSSARSARAPGMLGLGPAAYMASTKVLVGLLGVFLTFASASFYAFYEDQPRFWGLSPAEDQAVGGAIMALEQMIVMGAAFALAVRPDARRVRARRRSAPSATPSAALAARGPRRRRRARGPGRRVDARRARRRRAPNVTSP